MKDVRYSKTINRKQNKTKNTKTKTIFLGPALSLHCTSLGSSAGFRLKVRDMSSRVGQGMAQPPASSSHALLWRACCLGWMSGWIMVQYLRKPASDINSICSYASHMTSLNLPFLNGDYCNEQHRAGGKVLVCSSGRTYMRNFSQPTVHVICLYPLSLLSL